MRHDWDLAAADLLVHEAGGALTDVSPEKRWSIICMTRCTARFSRPDATVTQRCSIWCATAANRNSPDRDPKELHHVRSGPEQTASASRPRRRADATSTTSNSRISTRSTSSACFRITRPPMRPGRRRRSRPSTMRRCAISSCICIACSIPTRPQPKRRAELRGTLACCRHDDLRARAGFRKSIGMVAAEYLRFVYLTSRTVTEPADIYERAEPDLPVIIAMWHGQHFMAPFIKPDGHQRQDADFAPSRRRNERGRGGMAGRRDHPRLGRSWRRISTARAASARFRQMLDALAEGYNVALTADVPKVSRVAGLGHRPARARFRPADLSGRAGLAAAAWMLDNWDRSDDQLAVQPDRRRGRRRRSASPPTPTMRTLEAARHRGRDRAQRGHRARLRHCRRHGAVSPVAERLPHDLARLSARHVGGNAARSASG